MTIFNAGALPPATDDARAARLAAANDLVQRTLAQHGLVSGTSPQSGGLVQPGLPDINALLAKLGAAAQPTPLATEVVPDGAAFRQDEFTCAAGQRSYRTYVPASAVTGATGIVVMLHGCTQTPEDFAAGTGMNVLADRHGFVVIYPRQSRGDNAQSCWNWFSRGDQLRDKGEPAILAGMTRTVMAEFGVSQDRTFVAGLSAGAAMAVILAETYPDIFAAVGAHSGLPYGAARDVPSAFAAMAGGPEDIPNPVSRGAGTLRTMVIHGTADATVHPSNGAQIARSVLDRLPAQTIETETRSHAAGRSLSRTITSHPDGSVALEQWVVDGLGHAWSGGQSAGSYADPLGPDASAGLVRFFFNHPDKDI